MLTVSYDDIKTMLEMLGILGRILIMHFAPICSLTHKGKENLLLWWFFRFMSWCKFFFCAVGALCMFSYFS